MKIPELIKKIRLEKGYSFRSLGDKINFSSSFISDVEKGRANMSEKLLEAYIKEFPIYKNELIKAFTYQRLPILELEGQAKLEDITTKVSFFKFKVYNFYPKESGRVELENFSEVDFMQTNENGNLILNNGFVFRVCDDTMEPIFLLGDNLVFLKEKFECWEKFDKNIIMVSVNNDLYIRKLLFEGGEPFLVALNDRVYPKIQISKYKNVSFVAILDRRLEQNLRNLFF